jgi:hypothetical protein
LSQPPCHQQITGDHHVKKKVSCWNEVSRQDVDMKFVEPVYQGSSRLISATRSSQ